jgi:hypothetical protein
MTLEGLPILYTAMPGLERALVPYPFTRLTLNGVWLAQSSLLLKLLISLI